MGEKKTNAGTKRKAPARKKPHMISDIIKDLYEYTDKNPDAVEDSKRVFNTKDGPIPVKHIPIHKVIKILDEVVVHRHGGTWSDTLKYMSFQVDNAVICVNLVITDKYGTEVSRIGTGASNIYGGSGSHLSTDSIDNATKTAMSSALKKASSQFELGLSMWEGNKTPDPVVIKEKKGAITGGGKIHSDEKKDAPVKEGKEVTSEKKDPPSSKPDRLSDELASKITSKQKELNITQNEVITVLREKIPESNGNTSWLLSGNSEEKVDRLLTEVDNYMKGTEDAGKDNKS